MQEQIEPEETPKVYRDVEHVFQLPLYSAPAESLEREESQSDQAEQYENTILDDTRANESMLGLFDQSKGRNKGDTAISSSTN